MPQTKNPKDQEYPNELRRLREEKGLSQYALAKQMPGTKQQTIHRLEVGDTELTINDLPRFADFFGVEPAEIVGYKRLFRDPTKVAILETVDRMSPADRKRLLKMAAAFEPEAGVDVVARDGSRMMYIQAKDLPGAPESGDQELFDRVTAAIRSPLSTEEMAQSIRALAKAYGTNEGRVLLVVGAGVDRAAQEEGRTLSPGERDRLIANAITLACNELVHPAGGKRKALTRTR